MHYNLISILGPTAVGKTGLAAKLAAEYNGEIISADSRQVYRGMDIGTGKDLGDYIINGNPVPYHLIDVINPSEEFNLYLFNKLFYNAFADINSRSKIPFLVGGTGLYIHSILKKYNLNEVPFDKGRYSQLEPLSLKELADMLKGLNRELHNTTDLLEKERVIRSIMIAEAKPLSAEPKTKTVNPLVLGVNLSRGEIKKRITERLKLRLKNGMIEEVEKLVSEGIGYEKLDFFGLEYRYIGLYLSGNINYNDMFQKLNSAIHQFAKRQMTWFRKMEKEGIKIFWVEGPDKVKAEKIIEQYFFRNKG